MEGEEEPASPIPSSSVFKDITNFKTPKHTLRNPSSQSPFPHFFTASKQTPSSSFRRRPSICPPSRSKAVRKLKAFELEQSQSSRKAQVRKEKSLKSFSKSLSAWLNFLLENPKSCGCDLSSVLNGSNRRVEESGTVFPNGKRDSGIGCEVGIDGPWRSPKRQKDCYAMLVLYTGVKKEQIKVEVEDSKYMIIRTYATADGDETTISMPPAKSFMRKFRLPGLINIGGISAGYEDGVLTVTVPRSFVRGVLRIDLADLPDRHEILAAAA